MVRFDPGMIAEQMAKAPPSWTVKACNPEKTLAFGGNVVHFGLVGGPSFVSDLDRGRRAGDYEDFRNFMKLSYSTYRKNNRPIWIGGRVCGATHAARSSQSPAPSSG